jgi:hypothetical protein
MSEATSTSPLPPPSSLLLHLPQHRVVVCQDPKCHHALRPNTVAEHLYRIHKLIEKTRKPYVEYVKSLDLAHVDEVLHLEHGGHPIGGLRLHDRLVCWRCDYITTSPTQMRLHANQDHGWIKKHGPQWDVKPVQTFFTNNKTRYFIVAEPPEESRQTIPADDVDSMIQSLLDRQARKERDEEKERGKADEKQLELDNTPWLRKNGWPRRFAGRDPLAIAGFTNKPIKDEGTLWEICKSIDRVFGRCKKSIADCKEDGWDLLLSWLKSSKKDDYAPDPFGIYYQKSTHEKYTDYWKRFVCYCLRLLDQEDQHGAEFTEAQLQGLQELRAAVELDGEDEDQLDSQVLELSVSFLIQSDYADKKSALLHFAAVLGIDPKKNAYKLPHQYSSILAGLLYCTRLLLFEHALPTADSLWR